jgi:GalNAc-alpha-(1->4)-GalNAc-alpha-(1->3)-diNAcBac-PP-undecaprenol alpha-1,4-N-acetyl-D-galactosaminyltransferase
MMRATFVISSLEAGGAERVLSILANELVTRAWEITVISQDGHEGSKPFFTLDHRVILRYLDFAAIGESALPKTGKIRQLLALRSAIRHSNPNVVVSFMDTVNVRTLLAVWGLSIPVVISERCDPHTRPLGSWWERLRRLTYPRAVALVVQSPEAQSYFRGSIRERSIIIPNPVVQPPTIDRAEDVRRSNKIVSLGRLNAVKGFDRLLDAFQPIAVSNPEWQLEIWGEGPERGALEEQARRLGIADRVRFSGQTLDPYAAIRSSEIFVLSSRTEGFPMALGEAMACGIAAISFDCPSGPRQLIRHGIDGLLVRDGDIAGLSQAIQLLIDDPARRASLARKSPEVASRFSVSSISRRWEQVLRSAAAQPEAILSSQPAD